MSPGGDRIAYPLVAISWPRELIFLRVLRIFQVSLRQIYVGLTRTLLTYSLRCDTTEICLIEAEFRPKPPDCAGRKSL